ncbi:hypothetical protein NE865_03828 [Phthorimaea operculella]|nr:hypothetical protein NE865_03828 [Phthorimaea operculella]
MASNVIKCSTCNIVICELLAFVQNKVDVMDEESLARLCVTAFTPEEITAAKNLLFDSIATQQRKYINKLQRNVPRKGKGKSQRDLSDVISLLKQADPEDVPIFVAKELQKLPPVTFDHIDATRLLKDILHIQSELQNIKNRYATEEQLNQLKNEIKNLKHASIINNFDCNINKKRGGGRQLDSFCYGSGPMGLPHISNDPTASNASTPNYNNKSTERSSVEASIVPFSSTQEMHKSVSSAYDDQLRVRGEKETTTLSNTKVRSETTQQNPSDRCDDIEDRGSKSKEMAMNVEQAQQNLVLTNTSEHEQQKNSQQEQWKIVQSKKKSANRLTGSKGKAATVPGGKFKAAEYKIPLFINNVDKLTSESDIIHYIRQKTNVSIELKKIQMRRQKRYDAYKILVPHTKLSLFLDDGLWPEGIQFRRFVYFNRSTYEQNGVDQVINDEKNKIL